MEVTSERVNSQKNPSNSQKPETKSEPDYFIHDGQKFVFGGYNPKISRRLMEGITGLSTTSLAKYEQEGIINPRKSKYGGLEIVNYSIVDVVAIQKRRGKLNTEGCKVLSVGSQKGGVGKTFTATNLAGILSICGYKVLLIDADSQGDVSIALGLDGDSKKIERLDEASDPTLADLLDWTITDSDGTDYFPEEFRRLEPKDVIKRVSPTLDVIVGNLDISEINYSLNRLGLKKRVIDQATGATIPGELVVVREMVEKLKGDYDFIIFDLPPNIETLTVSCLYASDRILCPIELESRSLKVANRNESFFQKLVSLTEHLPDGYRFKFDKVVLFANKYQKQSLKMLAWGALQDLYSEPRESLNIELSQIILPSSSVIDRCTQAKEPVIAAASKYGKESKVNQTQAKMFTDMFWHIAHEVLDLEFDHYIFSKDSEQLSQEEGLDA